MWVLNTEESKLAVYVGFPLSPSARCFCRVAIDDKWLYVELSIGDSDVLHGSLLSGASALDRLIMRYVRLAFVFFFSVDTILVANVIILKFSGDS